METVNKEIISTNDLTVGFMGIAIASIFMILTWLPEWIFFCMLIVGAALFDTGYFAVGIITSLAMGVFTFISWFPAVIYWSGIVVCTVWLASKVVSKYVNVGAS